MKRALLFVLALLCVSNATYAQKRTSSNRDSKSSSRKETKTQVEKEWQDTPGMPAWSDADKQAHKEDKDWALEGYLWKPTPPAEGEPPQEETSVDLPAQTPAEEIESNKEVAGEILAEKWWSAYFAEKPKDLLVDPQGLLSKEEAVEIRERLAANAKDSGVDLVVYLFGGKQDIPGEVRWEEVAERLYDPEGKAKPTVLMGIFAGAPRRTILQLTPSMIDAIPAAERRRALDQAVNEAMETRQSVRQVHTLVDKMLIRIFWMDETMHGSRERNEPLVVLTEKAPEEKESKKEAIRKVVMGLVPLWPIAALVGGGLVGLFLLGWLWRWRARYRFPDIPVERRLGGPNAAGVGAVLSFQNPRVATAKQKDKVPDRIL